MEKGAKIYVAGHRGLVGSAIWNNLLQKGYSNLIGKTHHELDLMDSAAVARFFAEVKPEYVFLAAAHVGGIVANNTYRAAGVYQRAVCHRQDCGTEDVRELQPAVRHQLHCGDADQPVWPE